MYFTLSMQEIILTIAQLLLIKSTVFDIPNQYPMIGTNLSVSLSDLHDAALGCIMIQSYHTNSMD